MILEIQESCLSKHRYLLQGLDSKRTITLLDLLQLDEQVICNKLNCPWLNVDLLRKRISAMENCLLAINSPAIGWGNQALFFLQASPPEEDLEELEHRKTLDFFQDRGICAQGYYLRTNFWDKLEGDYGQWKISPLMSFSAPGWGKFSKDLCKNKSRIIGHRVPNYPRLLNVSDEVATELLARILIHDIGHTILPSIPTKNESLHNIFMIYSAGNGVRQPNFSSTWERLVWAESCDHYFFINGVYYLEDLVEEELDETQKKLLSWYRKAYLPILSPSRRRLWGILPDMDLTGRRIQVNKILGDLINLDFIQYSFD